MNRDLNTAFLVILVIGITARFVPVIASGNLFSTDVWPLYRDSTILLKHPEINVWNDAALDGYNNHWPAVILSTLVVSRITGLDLWVIYGFEVLGAVILVLILSLYLLYDYVLGGNKAIIALILAVFYPSLLVFTSALLKEVYGLPLLVIIWYLVVAQRTWEKTWIVLALLISLCLVYTHYFTLFILVGSLASYIIYSFIQYLRSGQTYTKIDITPSILLLIIASTSLAVSILPNTGHLPQMSIGIPAPILITYYFAVMFLVYGGQLFGSRVGLSKHTVLAVIVSVIMYSFATSRRLLLIPGMHLPVDSVILITVLSVVLALITTILGVHKDARVKIFIYSWMLFIGANTVFIILFTPLLGSIIHRFLNYLFIPLSMGVSYTITKNILNRAAVFTTIVLILASSSLLMHSAITYGSPYLFYWTYCDGEVNGFKIVLAYSPNNITLYGDNKVAYYSMTIRNINTMGMLQVITLNKMRGSNSLYIIYRGNRRYGYVVNTELYNINSFLANEQSMDRLFDNNWVEVYG